MNEEALKYSFELFKKDGYSGDYEQYKQLISSDSEALKYSHQLFSKDGYSGNINDFTDLVGVKKKDSSQVGSQKTQPTSGSKPAPSSNRSFAGSIDYLDQAPKFGEIPGAPKVPGTEGVVPTQKKVEQKPQQQQPKRTIVRGEEADQAIAESLTPQAPVAESTQPVKPVAPMTVEEGQLQKVIEKESQKPAQFINYQDIEKLYSDPENSTKDYFSMFLENAKKSEKGDIEYGKNLRDAYAAEFIDEEFENEYRLSSEIDNIDRKMRTELASLSEKAKTDPNAANLLQTKTNEYLSIINKKQKELDSAREQNNQRFKNRIAEIDNLFRTGEAALREDALLAEKNELVRKMNLIELAKNPNKLKDSVSKMEYDNIPGATAQDKLTNYLNSRLTAYDLFYNADKEADSLPQEMIGGVKDSYSKLKSELKDLYYLTSLRRYQNAEDRPGFFESAGEAFSKEFLDGGIDFSDSPQAHSENLQAIAKNAGIEFSPKDKSYIETTSAPADPYSGEWWGDMLGNTLAFGANIAVTAPIGATSLKVGEGIIKATPKLKKLAEYGLKRYSKLSSTGQKITNGVFNSLDEGYNFEMANQLIYDGESDELTFLTGVGGAVMAAPVNKLLGKAGKLLFSKYDDTIEAVAGKAYTKEEAAALEALGAQTDDVRNFLSGVTKENGIDDYVYMLQGTFGNKAPEAIKQIQKVGAVLIARPTGEVAQEMGEELTSIYKQSDSFEAFKQEFSKRFPDADAMTQFVVAAYTMGGGFGAGNYVGEVFSAQAKKSFDQLPPDQQAIAAEAIKEATQDINNADAEAINEIELDEASRPKSKEEEEWIAKEAEIKQGIDNSTKRVNELDGLRNEIYSAYNITDPKTEDISVLSETDAIKLELLNKEIKKAQEAKIKDEIEMEIHNKNKPVVDQTPVNAIHAKDLETKKETDAVQEPSAEKVLPRQQGATTETGGKPKGMGQSVQGQEVTQEGQEVSQEGIEAKKADIERRRQEDLKNINLGLENYTQHGLVAELGDTEGSVGQESIVGVGKSTKIKLTPEEQKELNQQFKAYTKNLTTAKEFNEWRKDFSNRVLNRAKNEINSKYDSEIAALEGKQEVSQEGATLNKEPFTEDVAPEQKAKVEEQNKKDEEEAVTEIYDFNDEIKSIGTKEQFKAFLKTLVPEGVFSRIAWHNTSKPELTPREKQYYTNTRKNAEDTYKQENTFPAIIFGNNPKKATFDEVQNVDTEAVKGSGNDIVITDDLSPAIGADMNYREFVTTNADQVIPLATKENIDAFKAFVEQQKASEKDITDNKLSNVEETAKAIESKFDPDYKNNIIDQLSSFDKQIEEKKFPSALEVAEKVLPRSIFNRYKSLYELAARNNIKVSNERLPYGMVAAWAYNSIQLNKDIAKRDIHSYEEFAEVLNHEIIHGLINYGVRKQYNLYVDLQSVANSVYDRYDSANDRVKEIIDYIKDTSLEFVEKDVLGATDEELKSEKFREIGSLEELITYAFTNTEFAEFLSKIPASKEIKSKGSNIFEQLKNIIKSIIGGLTKSPTALDEINNVLENYFDTSWNESNIKERNDLYNWGLKFNADENIFDEYNNDPQIISEAYHKAKQDGSNPELVQAVEELLGKKEKTSPTPQATEQVTPQAQEVKEEKAPEVESGQEVAETSEFTEEETQSAIKEYEDIMSKPGIDKLDAKREFIEKYGALGERVVDIDSNFDNILDKLGAIKTCTIEIIRK